MKKNLAEDNLDPDLSVKRAEGTESKKEQLPNAEVPEARIEAKETPLPPFTVDFFFGVHGSREDAEGLEKSFEKADIYIPERHGWSDLTLTYFNDLSLGRITPEGVIAETRFDKKHPMFGFLQREMELVYKSYKPVIILDVPHGHQNQQQLDDHYRANRYSEQAHQNFKRMLQEIKVKIRKEADLHNEREDYMLGQLFPKIREVLEKRPDLASKKDLRVLMFLGSAHTRISHLVAQFGQKTTRTFSRPVMRYGFANEAHRRFALGKEVDNELAAKVILEDLVTTLVYGLAEEYTSDSDKIIRLITKIVAKFTMEEIETLYNLPLRQAVLEFARYLFEKGITLPNNRNEFEKFISTN